MSTGTFTGRLPTAPATAAAIGPVEAAAIGPATAAVIAPAEAVIAPAEAAIAPAAADTAVLEVIGAAAATVAEANPTR